MIKLERKMKFTRHELSGKALTVLGSLAGSELGITLSHEHCLFDVGHIFDEPNESLAKKIFNEPLSLNNLGYVRYGYDNKDNYQNLDEDLAVAELMHFKKNGGRTIAEATTIDLGRNPLALRSISMATELNIIMGSGYYVEKSQQLYTANSRTEEDIAEEIVRDIFEGVDNTDIHAGMIGEIGCSYPLKACELRALRAAGLAQQETGAPLHIHPGRSESAPFEIIEILKEVGADLTRTVIDHIDRTLFDSKDLYKLAESGCYLEYDLWGHEGYYPESLATIDLPNDTRRIAVIKDLMEKGYGNQILISQDIDQKFRYMAFGGHGFSHILNNALPAMRRRGISDQQIDCLLIENPRRLFSFQ